MIIILKELVVWNTNKCNQSVFYNKIKILREKNGIASVVNSNNVLLVALGGCCNLREFKFKFRFRNVGRAEIVKILIYSFQFHDSNYIR